MANTVYLQTPVSEEEIRALRVDDIVYLSGEAYSMLYADHYSLIMERLAAKKGIPMQFKGSAIYHTGTIWRRTAEGGYDLRALGTTTSSKFNAQTPAFIEKTGVRIVMGKGGMDEKNLAAMKRFGCVYLALVGGCSAIYTSHAEIAEDYWPELMPTDNQRLKFRLKEFGPLFVAMDAHGNSAYEQAAGEAGRNRTAIYERLGIESESGL
ncbi:MAG: hypothetical protein HFE84_07260 [Lachnospiraceae bacterium]|nr:hypothetical protein [Lachnospiraceae bacterium]